VSDAATPSSLPQMIMEVPESVWKKLSAALGVNTRMEAAELVQADQEAAAVANGIIRQAMAGKSALTSRPPSPKTALTTPPPAASYGGGGKARLKIG